MPPENQAIAPGLAARPGRPGMARQFADPADGKLPPGQASDLGAWRASLQRIRSVVAARVHFCHHTDVNHACRARP